VSCSNDSFINATMANNGTVPSQSTQSSDAVAATIEADNVLTLAEKRKLAEKYLMTTLCSSREFDFMAMCDDQSQPFWCDINDPSQTTQSGHVVDTIEPQNDVAIIKPDTGSPVFNFELPKWGTPEYWRLFQTDDTTQ
jgi:hypothetical protein